MTDNKARLNYIDFAKALAIILVGVGHYGNVSALKCFIYMFHIPLFFIVSGMTFNPSKYRFLLFLKRKVKGLLLPWVGGVVLFIAFQNICSILGLSVGRKVSFLSIIGRIIINIRGSKYDPIFWFLPALFLAEIILYFVLKLVNNMRKEIIWLVLIGFVSVVFMIFINKAWPWSLDILPISLLFLTYGFILNKYLFESLKTSKGIIKSGFLLIGLLVGIINKIISKKDVDIFSNQYGNPLLMILAAILLSTFFILVGIYVNNRVILFIGENSLKYYILQSVAFPVSDILLALLLNRLLKYDYSYDQRILDNIILQITAIINIGIVVLLWNKIITVIKSNICVNKTTN